MSVRPLLAIWLAVSALQGQTVVYSNWKPLVIPSDVATSVILEAKVTGSPTRVALDFQVFGQPTTTVDLNDSGTNGDVASGDGVWSVTLPGQQVAGGLQIDDVYRRFVGFLRLYQGASVVVSSNIFAQIVDPSAPRPAVVSDAGDVQHTNYVINVWNASFFNTFNIGAISNRVYQLFPDTFDFLAVVWIPDHFQNRYHFTVRNEVQGIGQSISNNSAAYGSAGKLKGINVFPSSGFFDGMTTGYQHETGHQWVSFLNQAPFAVGVPHWPVSSMASGIMGFSIGGMGGQGGAFPCVVTPVQGGLQLSPRVSAAVFTDLDLYLMGLIPSGQVGTNYIFNDPNGVLAAGCTGQVYAGSTTAVSASDVISLFGPRIPASSGSQRRFRMATVVVSRDGLLNADAMALFSLLTRRAQESQPGFVHEGLSKYTGGGWAFSTGGRGSLDTRVVALPTPSIGAFNSSQAAWLLDTNGNYTWDGTPTDFYHVFGSPNSIPVVGDWTGDGTKNIGEFNSSSGIWLLDMNGNGVWDGPVVDKQVSWGSPGDIPVVGNWNGLGVPDKIGTFNPGSGSWLLDYNGNFTWDGTGTDKFVVWGSPGDKPVVGDWNGSGTAKIGIFNPTQGWWLLDYNGNYAWEGAGTDRFLKWGSPGDTPVVGDWTGSGTTKIGVFNSAQAAWLLDYNGNYAWDGAGTDKFLSWGSSGDIPVVGDWDGSGASKIAVFNPSQGWWVIDYNGNYVWEGAVTDRFLKWGSPGDTPIVGRW